MGANARQAPKRQPGDLVCHSSGNTPLSQAARTFALTVILGLVIGNIAGELVRLSY